MQTMPQCYHKVWPVLLPKSISQKISRVIGFFQQRYFEEQKHMKIEKEMRENEARRHKDVYL